MIFSNSNSIKAILEAWNDHMTQEKKMKIGRDKIKNADPTFLSSGGLLRMKVNKLQQINWKFTIKNFNTADLLSKRHLW